jgi:hypothetical protein
MDLSNICEHNISFSFSELASHIKVQSKLFKPNVMAKWLALLLHIWEVSGSNLGLETDYPD